MTTEEELLRLPFGDRIRYVRRDILGVNQEAFARRVGVSPRTVRRWEASFIAPSREKAEKIAALADLASELFYPDDTVEPDPNVEVRQMLVALEKTVAGLEAGFTTVAERMIATLAEMEVQLARQTDLLQAIGKKVEDSDPGEPKQRRARRRKS